MTRGAEPAPGEVGDRGAQHVLRPSVLAWAVLGALAISFVAVLVGADGSASLTGRVGGDFPAFHAAGQIVRDGDLDELYSLERQQEEQRDLLGGEDGVLYFAYPPPVAALYALLASLPYVTAYAVHTALMAAALVASWALVRPMLPRPPDGEVVGAVAVTFLPMFVAVTLGQNTALLVLAVAAWWRLQHDDHDVAAGVVAGLLLFKPQYAVPLIGVLVLRRRFGAAAAAVAVGALWWAAGAAMSGTGWVADWWTVVGEFGATDAEVNGRNAVSWLGLAEHALGPGTLPAIVLGGGAAAVTVAIVVSLWWRARRANLAAAVAVLVPALLLMSPHAMYYDAGLLVLAAAALAASDRRPSALPIAMLWLLGAAHPAKAVLGFTPVTLAVIAAFAFATVAATSRPVPRALLAGGVHPTDSDRVASVRGRAWGSDDPPELTVVIPAFDEVGRIEPTLALLAEWISAGRRSVEVIVVDDGSSDGTSEAVLAMADRFDALSVIRLGVNSGKGCAVRIGMLAGRGRWRAFLDADGSTAPAELDKLLAVGSAVAVASVAAPGAVVDRAQPGVRSVAGQVGNRVVQRLVLPGIADSQRGCKLFRGDVADVVFSRCHIDGWGFDVEALALARSAGHEPTEVGIVWHHRPVGHVRPWHYLSTVVEVARVRRQVGHQPPVA